MRSTDDALLMAIVKECQSILTYFEVPFKGYVQEFSDRDSTEGCTGTILGSWLISSQEAGPSVEALGQVPTMDETDGRVLYKSGYFKFHADQTQNILLLESILGPKSGFGFEYRIIPKDAGLQIKRHSRPIWRA
jgi:hypothetical protein